MVEVFACRDGRHDPAGLVAIVEKLLFALILFAAPGCGLAGGVFFAFPTFVMKALARLPAGEGIAAMQSINIVVINPWFMTAFLGTAVLCVLALIYSVLRWQDPGAAYLLAGSVLYLAGSLLVTIAFNVPRNNRLAAVARSDPAGAKLRADYVRAGQPGTTCGLLRR